MTTEAAPPATVDRPRALKGALTGTAWLPQTPLDLQTWADQGRRLGSVSRAVGWWIGDWLRYGNLQFGEKYARASRITGYDVQTLMNMVYVASAYEVSERREELSWSHHAELASMEPEMRNELLDRAVHSRMSVRCLREEARRERRAREIAAGHESDGSHTEAAARDRDHDLRCPQCGCQIEQAAAASAATAQA